ncbi:MAG: HlyD family efflux transporter periplasmic adaptor subunit [Oscillospiraceae bacterium]|nr:HlyD family efflux transporter periplasmic adaptor subunit [Oscillospiraceae bacterium]MBQ6942742.1 HlyD family efflux transporter periplasmic adaptor subunit [Ruminococcus sp.]
MKKIIAAVCAVLIVAGGTGYGIYRYKKADKNTEGIIKEVSVEFGNVTAGVTESNSVNVSALSQTYDLTLASTSVSASVEASGGGSSSGGGMSMGGMGIGGGMGMGGGSSMPMGSTSVSTSSSSSSVELIVDEVFISAGQTVSEGDIIMSITQESIDAARTELTDAVSDAELALAQAKIEENETLLSAKYEYDTRIAEGSSALSTYNAKLDEIASNISALSSQIAETESEIAELEDAVANGNSQSEMQLTPARSQLENYQSQLSSAQSTRSSDELAAKQEYEEALMYYENAQQLYDIAVSDMGDATASAQEAVDTAKDNLKAFESYISDGNIKAEYSGTIMSVGYASGDTLSADTAIAEYADAETITVTVNVTEDDIAAVRLDEVVEVTFLSYPDEIFSGYVSEIGSSSSSANSSTVSYPVTVVITTVPETILTGMTANVTFITKQVKDVLYISNRAVITDGTDSYVTKKLADGTKEKLRVQTGFSNGNYVEVSGELSEGDTILIESKVE